MPMAPATTFFLVRHGEHEVGSNVLVGRTLGIGLSDHGREQIAAAAEEPWTHSLDLVQSSPRRRALQSSGLIARAARCDISISAAFDEVNYGDWNGRPLPQLEGQPAWQKWNNDRANAETPAGDTMRAVQWRALDQLVQLDREKSGQRIAVVTHAEVIRAVMLASWSLPVSEWWRVDVPLASVWQVRVAEQSLETDHILEEHVA